jgi:TRAP-type C4-dicarboxylate transport system substrate-binding protein
MLDVHIAPLTGALIVSNSVWNRIAPEDRVKVTAAAEVFEKRMRAEIPEQDATSVTTMVKMGRAHGHHPGREGRSRIPNGGGPARGLYARVNGAG